MLMQDRIVIVTGVANEKSISWGVAKALYREGAKLIFTFRKEKSLRKLKKLLEVNGIEAVSMVPCDILDDESIGEAFLKIEKQVGEVHSLVHSIAYAEISELQGRFIDTSREGYILAQNASAYSLVALVKQAQRLMHPGGSIVTQTYFGSQRVVKKYNVMGVAKAALESCVRYLADDLGPFGIRINAVSAGPVRTSASSAIPGLDEKLAMIEQKAPLRRNIDQDEIGDTTMFLLSRLARGITGEIIHVDAGYHILGM